MLIEQRFWIWIEGAWGPLAVRVLHNWLFPWQNKYLKANSMSGLLFTAKL